MNELSGVHPARHHGAKLRASLVVTMTWTLRSMVDDATR
jgi:hypothetical protein